MISCGQLCDNISVVVVELASLELESICDKTTYFGYEGSVNAYRLLKESPVYAGQLLTCERY